MAKNIYTLQQYVFKINNKEVHYFEIKAYKAEYENALFSFGKSNLCSKIKPYTEDFTITRKRAEEWKQGLEKSVEKCKDYELYNYKQHGFLEDYNWEWNEQKRINYGTKKEKEQ